MKNGENKSEREKNGKETQMATSDWFLSFILKVKLQVLLTSAATVFFSAIMTHFDTDHCCEFYILTAFFVHGTGTLRNSEWKVLSES